jgi:hypothetical protein
MLLSGVNVNKPNLRTQNSYTPSVGGKIKPKTISLIDTIKHETTYDNLSDTEKTLVTPIKTEQDKEKFVDAFLKKSEELTQQARAKYRTNQDDIDNDLAEQHLANGNPEQAIELYQKVYDRAKKYDYLDTEEFGNLLLSYREVRNFESYYNLLNSYYQYRLCKTSIEFGNNLYDANLKNKFKENLLKVREKDDILKKILSNDKNLINDFAVRNVFISGLHNEFTAPQMKKFKTYLPQINEMMREDSNENCSLIENFIYFQNALAESKK